jgi:hypothetical protein
MKHDGARFEENEAVFLKERYLPKGLQRAIFRLVLIALFQEARLIRQSGFLQCPACAQIADLTSCEVWNPLNAVIVIMEFSSQA